MDLTFKKSAGKNPAATKKRPGWLRPVESRDLRPDHPTTGAAKLPSRDQSAATSTEWDVALLWEIEKQFTRFIGPIARTLVQRYSQQTNDVDALYAALAEKLDNDKERAAFRAGRRALSAGPRTRRSPPPSAESPPAGDCTDEPLSVRDLDVAERRLAFYLGPIAKIIVNRTRAQVGSVQELYERLAQHLTEENEREEFLAARRRP